MTLNIEIAMQDIFSNVYALHSILQHRRGGKLRAEGVGGGGGGGGGNREKSEALDERASYCLNFPKIYG